MKLTDRPTPRTDEAISTDYYCSGMVDADISRSLEQRLAHAVEALTGIAMADELYKARYSAKKVLSEIEAAQEERNK